jgi:hypothetical protein
VGRPPEREQLSPDCGHRTPQLKRIPLDSANVTVEHCHGVYSSYNGRSPLGPAAIALVVLLAGCTEPLRPSHVTGMFVLESANEAPVPVPGINAPVAGIITLTASGGAERHISYTIDSLGTVREFVATGTYQLMGSELRLALREGTSVWTPSANLVGTTITLTYPHPADGPDIVERYRQR